MRRDAFGSVEYLTGERIVPRERERNGRKGGRGENREALPLPAIATDVAHPVGRYIQAATATCISISAELEAIDAGRFIALFTATAMAAIAANSAGIFSRGLALSVSRAIFRRKQPRREISSAKLRVYTCP